jgi:hypothetical protein
LNSDVSGTAIAEPLFSISRHDDPRVLGLVSGAKQETQGRENREQASHTPGLRTARAGRRTSTPDPQKNPSVLVPT